MKKNYVIMVEGDEHECRFVKEVIEMVDKKVKGDIEFHAMGTIEYADGTIENHFFATANYEFKASKDNLRTLVRLFKGVYHGKVYRQGKRIYKVVTY